MSRSPPTSTPDGILNRKRGKQCPDPGLGKTNLGATTDRLDPKPGLSRHRRRGRPRPGLLRRPLGGSPIAPLKPMNTTAFLLESDPPCFTHSLPARTAA